MSIQRTEIIMCDGGDGEVTTAQRDPKATNVVELLVQGAYLHFHSPDCLKTYGEKLVQERHAKIAEIEAVEGPKRAQHMKDHPEEYPEEMRNGS